MIQVRIPKEIQRQLTKYVHKMLTFFEPDDMGDIHYIKKLMLSTVMGKNPHTILWIDQEYLRIQAMNDVTEEVVEIEVDDVAIDTFEIDIESDEIFELFFSLYSRFGSLQHLIEEWEQSVLRQPQKKIPSTTKKIQKDEKIQRSPVVWTTRLEELIAPLAVIQETDSFYLFQSEFEHLRQKLIVQEPYEWEWKAMFRIYKNLILLEQLMPYLGQKMNQSYLIAYEKWQIEFLLEKIQNEIAESIHAVTGNIHLFDFEPFVLGIPQRVRDFFFSTPHLFGYRFSLYQLFWESPLAKEWDMEEEKKHIQQSDHVDQSFLLGFFAVHAGEDLAFADVLLQAEEVPLETLVQFAEYAASEYRGDLVEQIADYVDKQGHSNDLEQLSASQIVIRLHQLDQLYELANVDADRRERLYQQYPEQSKEMYSNFLIEQNRYADWLSLSIVFKLPAYMIENQLDYVSKASPQHAFPMYHQFVIREINGRTRASYKAAVRLLKKMKTLARKQGKTTWWNDYVQLLRENHRRLRAFQEEVEKGNLSL